MAAFAVASPALAVSPSLTAVGHQQRHPTATFSAPKAGSATIYLASRPDRATDGSFLSENIRESGFLTDSELQSGRWFDASRVDPGTYYVMLQARPDFDSCYIFGSGLYDPACADGFSNILTLIVEKPRIRYSARVTAYRFLGQASLYLTATPLGEKLPYRVCYVTKSRAKRCLTGSLNGYSWDSSGEDNLDVRTRNLPTITTFTWYVGGKKVAAKSVRVR